MSVFPITFTAPVIQGSGRGKNIGAATINLDLSAIPNTLEEGIYVCRVSFESESNLDAVMHYGPRPVFHDSTSCEVHVLDRTISAPSATLLVQVIARLRDVADFPSKDDLMIQIERDIEDARVILRTHGSADNKEAGS